MISKRYKNDGKSILKLNQVQINAKERIEKKIKNGEYTYENIYCTICDSSESELLSEKDRYGLDYQVVVCKKCGLVYTNPRMIAEAYADFYDKDYRKLYLGTETPKASYFNRQYKRAKDIYHFIEKHSSSLSKTNPVILEIGCGAGGVLSYFAKRGCKVFGVDLDSEYVEFGKEIQGLNLIHGSILDVPDDLNPEIIIYSHVMEHILDINSELQNIKNLCTPDTIIYVEVPGIKNIHVAYKMDSLLYFQNAHTYHF
jgi:hypothetical protein